MTRSYFVDTWFVIGAFDRFDTANRAVRQLGDRLSGAELVTHDAVLMEFLAFVSGSGAMNRRAAVQFVRDTALRYTVLPAGRELFVRALDLYDNRTDKEYSLVDCMSMVVMKERSIRHVLTNDHHFRQEGFEVVNE
ncbi:MAG: PIN domain-containing protein [Acidobacteriota bacterium]|nr:PIN domain-containing protein [Acidobacteriota bacterium]